MHLLALLSSIDFRTKNLHKLLFTHLITFNIYFTKTSLITDAFTFHRVFVPLETKKNCQKKLNAGAKYPSLLSSTKAKVGKIVNDFLSSFQQNTNAYFAQRYR